MSNLFRLLMLIGAFCFSAQVLVPASAQSSLDVFETSISALQDALESGAITSVELVDLYVARINAYDQQGPALNSIVRINPAARTLAAALDAERQRTGARSQLHGIPILVKDNYNTTDMPTTGGSVALAGFVPSANATQVDKLLAAGAIVLAKTNLHEYAYGITSIGSLLGQTRNPYDPRRVPGGSSGGTAAAVAASFGAIGMGSDTCGSIRIPSAFNNLIGLRPTKGLSSIYGIMPLSHTQDVAGPLARSAEDLAILLDIVIGFDANDAATALMQGAPLPNFQAQLQSTDLTQLRIGKLTSYYTAADPAIRQQMDAALSWFEERGAEIIDVEIPDLAGLIARSGLIGHEFRVDLDQYLATFLSNDITNLNDIVDLGLYHEAIQAVLVRSRTSVRNDDSYTTALSARDDLRAAIAQLLQSQDLDAIAYPPIAELQVFTGENQAGNNCSISANSGMPALSFPIGFTPSGLPVGLELLGAMQSDAQLLAMGYAFEQANAVRKAPSTTPPLQAGVAPPARISTLNFSAAGISVQGTITVEVTTNLLQFAVTGAATAGNELYAATLIIDADSAFELTDPSVLNLLGPQRSAASGEHYMSANLREAMQAQRVYLKVFGSSLPREGLTYRLP